jgi:hypothetical protein
MHPGIGEIPRTVPALRFPPEMRGSPPYGCGGLTAIRDAGQLTAAVIRIASWVRERTPSLR